MKGCSEMGISYGHALWLLPIEMIRISISHLSVEDIRVGVSFNEVVNASLHCFHGMTQLSICTHLLPILHYDP